MTGELPVGQASNAVAVDIARAAIAPLHMACIIPSLRAGGAERVLCGLAGALADRGHWITIVTLMDAGETAFYALSPKVDLVNVGGLGERVSLSNPASLLQAAWRLRRAVSQSTARLVLGFTTLGSMLAVLATGRARRRSGRDGAVPVVVAERIDPGAHAQRIGRLRTAVRDHLYGRADHVVVQTERARRSLAWLPAGRLSIIGNPIHPVAGMAQPGQAGPDGRFRLLAIGRLDRQKGFDILVDAFGQVSAMSPAWDLIIHGDGPERPALERQIVSLGLQAKIRLPGVTNSPQTIMLGAHALAFPSRYEGFPNALGEAMAVGLPAVGFGDVSGVEDLIRSGDTGLLADWSAPIDSLARHLGALMADADLRTRLGLRGRQHVAAFQPQIHYDQWESLLASVARSAA